jgi:hypothetical protein
MSYIHVLIHSDCLGIDDFKNYSVNNEQNMKYVLSYIVFLYKTFMCRSISVVNVQKTVNVLINLTD